MRKLLLFIAFISFVNFAKAQYTDVLNFVGQNGRWPMGDLVSDGTFLYGMTENGGITSNCNDYSKISFNCIIV
jgi:hypothetical protein